ncbi:unnamed protein product [Urochloa humidicola]
MANFPCNPMLFVPPGLHVEQGWQRPARSRVALGGEPPRRHEQYAIVRLEPEPIADQVQDLLNDVSEMLEHDFPVRVVSSFPSPLGLGLFQFDSPVQRQTLLDASPIQFGHGWLTIQKHDEARNFRACPYIRECWIMFLAFPLDYQSLDYIRAAVAPFGRLIHWIDGPNKSRVLTQCLVLSPDRVPRTVVVSQGTVLGGNGRSWSVPVFILGGHFPDAFPPEEEPVPVDGNPHPWNGNVQEGNPNIIQNWQHELAGAAPAVHIDAGVNAEQMQEVQEELGNQNVEANMGWDDWDQPDQEQAADNIQWDDDADEVVPQESISFDQSGSTAEYLRATGPDIVLNLVDVRKGLFVSSPSSSTDSSGEVVSGTSVAFQLAENLAFSNLSTPAIPRVLQPPVHIPGERINTVVVRPDDADRLAVVPFMPSLHAVLISIWANSQVDNPIMDTAPDPDFHIPAQEVDNLQLDQQLMDVPATLPSVRLPDIVSAENENTPLAASFVRRSSRINRDKDGFKQVQHIQLEDNPRKKRRVWKEVALTPKEAAQLLNNPPKPTDEEYPGAIPTDTLKSWGILCNVSPEELTEEALKQVVSNEETTE